MVYCFVVFVVLFMGVVGVVLMIIMFGDINVVWFVLFGVVVLLVF